MWILRDNFTRGQCKSTNIYLSQVTDHSSFSSIRISSSYSILCLSCCTCNNTIEMFIVSYKLADPPLKFFTIFKSPLGLTKVSQVTREQIFHRPCPPTSINMAFFKILFNLLSQSIHTELGGILFILDFEEHISCMLAAPMGQISNALADLFWTMNWTNLFCFKMIELTVKS